MSKCMFTAWLIIIAVAIYVVLWLPERPASRRHEQTEED